MEKNDKFTGAILQHELSRLNSHLPKNRITLEELRADPSLTVQSVSGHTIRMRKPEIDELSAALPLEASRKVSLPIVLVRRRDLGPGAFRLLGDPYEEYALLLLTGGFRGAFEEFRTQNSGTVTFYKPQVSLLLRKFHSLFVIGFGSAGNEMGWAAE